MASHRSSQCALALTLLLLVIAGCSGSGGSRADAPAGAPFIRGVVASITHHATATGLLVRPGPGPFDPCGLLATADAGTRYWRRTGEGGLRPAALADVAEGGTVEVYVSGPVRESCPVQGEAAHVVLVAGGA